MEKENIKEENKQASKAYLYLIKTPVNNDLSVSASDSVYYPGTYVIAPTRFGLDMCVVVGSVEDLNGGNSYTPGCSQVCGACHFGSTSSNENEDLAASGEPETLPVYKFESVSTIEPEEDTEENILWNKRYRDPVLTDVDGDVLWINRMASPDEIKRYHQNLEEEKEAIKVCKEKIEKHKLEMKLVTAHFLLCEPKALFFFTAEDRVDFRDLVKDLVSVFKMRIELRQIGVRDESRVLGGLAACGRDFCCHCVSDKLDPVTIKMAKEQNMSLNSMKISGPCGRLLCCLSYEYDFYCEEKAAYPQEGTRIKIGEDFYRISEINILSKSVTAQGEEGGFVSIPRSQLYFSEKNTRWEVSREFQQNF